MVAFYGIPCHTWCFDFFVSLSNSLGSFVCLDENTVSDANMDISRMIVRVPVDFNMKDSMWVMIDGVDFTILMREDSYDPLRLWKDFDAAYKAYSLCSSKESWGNLDRELGEKKNSGSSEGSFSTWE